MAYNVGEAEVTIVPNAQRFNEDLAAKLVPGAAEVGRTMGDEIANRIRERLATIGDVRIGVDTGLASAEVDKFLAETDVKAKAAGNEAGKGLGDNLSKSAASSTRGGSPIIMAAVAGGLLEGAPLMIAAAGLLFGGIAAVAVHSVPVVHDAATKMANDVMHTFQSAAQVTVPFFVSAIQRVGAAVTNLGPQFHTAFAALGGPVDSLTTGLVSLMQNTMPGLVAAVQSAGPVFQGLASLLASIGTGLGQFFSIIAQHSPAAGIAFSSLGSIVSALLPILGQLVGAGAELAANVLPPVAAALHAVASALDLIAPVLPSVLAGFVAFKAVSMLSGPLGLLSAKLQTVAADSEGMALKLSGGAATAVSRLGSALPVMGVALSALSSLFQMQAQQIDEWGTALLNGGAAAEAANAAMAKQASGAAALGQGTQGLIYDFLGLGSALNVAGAQHTQAAAAAKAQYDAMSPLQQRAQDVTTATNNLQLAQQKYGAGSEQAIAAAGRLAGAQASQKTAQQELTAATQAALNPDEQHRAALDAIATAASQAKTDTKLLKDALDALSGKTVDAVTAQIQLQDAIANATTATKGLKGSVVDANGHLNIYSASGRAAGTALLNIRDSGNQLIATLEHQGATSEQVKAADANLRSSFIQTAQKMGFSASQARNLADQILGIPSSRTTEITADTKPAVNAINAVLTALARLRNKTVTVTTVTAGYHVGGGGGPGGTQLANARGNLVHAYAGGGIEPMQGGIAQIVAPNTLRVIGDRVTDDEAYIPINRDLRSIAIWRQAGERMGQLAAATSATGSASGSTGGGAPMFSVGTMIVPDKQHPAETAEQLAFLARTRG